jgi:hypothetical protein
MKKEFKNIMVDTITKAKMDKAICSIGKKMSYPALINWLIDNNDKKSIDEKDKV